VSLNAVLRRLHQFDDPELRALIAACQDLLARRAEAEEDEGCSDGLHCESGGGGRRKGAGYIEYKMIPGPNGKQYGPYAYLRWREGRVHRSKYLGKAGAD